MTTASSSPHKRTRGKGNKLAKSLRRKEKKREAVKALSAAEREQRAINIQRNKFARVVTKSTRAATASAAPIPLLINFFFRIEPATFDPETNMRVPARVTTSTAPLPQNFTVVRQAASCHRMRHSTLPRQLLSDLSCNVDECRFQDIRAFIVVQKRPIGVVFSVERETESPIWPVQEWKKEYRVNLLDRKVHVARALLPYIQQELAHQTNPNVVCVSRDLGTRVNCDQCSTGVMGGSWLCRVCGGELCLECHGHLPGSLFCKNNARHQPENFAPLTRFTASEVKPALLEMQMLVSTHPAPYRPPVPAAVVDDPLPYRPDEESILIYEVLRLSSPAEEPFRSALADGAPFVLSKLRAELSNIWHPTYWATQFGDTPCTVIDWQTTAASPSTIGAFFTDFGKPGRTLKIKDLPPTENFAQFSPSHHSEFEALIPGTIRSKSQDNFFSSFPENANAMDPGPKMYNADPNRAVDIKQPSTALHVDLSDAINILVHGVPNLGQEEEAMAAWDLFREQDTPALCDYLRRKCAIPEEEHPIQLQTLYVDDDMRRELAQQGIFSYRVYQKVGEAIVIPAGWPHQV
uniref:Clavaminate synthase-like protein n=1 Tax=Mycena chlorophos TaxID=658473 RepID=A0ABQ0KVX0_MYCCL|nr:clavaminate synthase-like protein [Mycena chlorophos]